MEIYFVINANFKQVCFIEVNVCINVKMVESNLSDYKYAQFPEFHSHSLHDLGFERIEILILT